MNPSTETVQHVVTIKQSMVVKTVATACITIFTLKVIHQAFNQVLDDQKARKEKKAS